MLNILIADDENKVCQLIKSLVDWEALDMRVIATAENGIEALEKIRELTPDIAITDIRMPGYDGLELVRLAKETNPRTEFIIISGYRHFEYAQSAIRYGVNSYLLKPIKKDELTDTLTRLGEKLRERTRQLSYEEKVLRTLKSDEETLRQTFLSDLVYRRDKTLKTASLDRINEDFHYGLRPGNFCFGILKLDGHVFDDMENLRFMADKVRGVMDRLLPECTFDYELLVAGSFFYFLLNFEESMRSQVRRQMKALFDEIRIQGGILKDFAATLSLGTVCGGLDGLDSSLKNARLLIEERLVAGTGKLLEGELPQKGSFADSTLFAEFNSRMSQALESLDVLSVREALQQLKSQMLASPGITGHELLQMTKEVCNLYLFFMKNYRIRIEDDFLENYNLGADNCASAQELFDYLIRKITASYDMAARLKRQDENRPVRVAKQYISEHYATALTLEEVSAVAGLSPAYLATVFKKDTGMTFLEYVSKVRMDMAKQLLKETSCTVADICEKVGYSDVRYFTKTFTKYSGLKPNEYRKLYS